MGLVEQHVPLLHLAFVGCAQEAKEAAAVEAADGHSVQPDEQVDRDAVAYGVAGREVEEARRRRDEQDAAGAEADEQPVRAWPVGACQDTYDRVLSLPYAEQAGLVRSPVR